MKDSEIGQEVWLLFLDLIAAQRRDASSPETVALTTKWMEATKRIDEMATLVNDMTMGKEQTEGERSLKEWRKQGYMYYE